MKHVFATQSAIVAHPVTGVAVQVLHGSHWWDGDPIVQEYPTFFTDDARFGLTASAPFGEDGYPQGYVDDEDDDEDGGSKTTPPTPTETADAAPGTKRSRGRGAGRS